MIIELSREEPVVSHPPLTPAPQAVADVLRVLADPTRLRIFRFLRDGEACVCEIATALQLAENLVSHHLRALRGVALVQRRTDPNDARWVYYQLDTQTLMQVFTELGALFDPHTVGIRVPTCGPAALIVPRRSRADSAS